MSNEGADKVSLLSCSFSSSKTLKVHELFVKQVFEERKHDDKVIKMAELSYPSYTSSKKMELNSKIRSRCLMLLGCHENSDGGFVCLLFVLPSSQSITYQQHHLLINRSFNQPITINRSQSPYIFLNQSINLNVFILRLKSDPRVKSLHTFSFFLAYALVEASHHDVSTTQNRVAVESYALSLQNFSGADSVMYNNLGVSIIELIRKLKSINHDVKEIKRLLSLAEMTFSDAIDLLEMMDGRSDAVMAETLMNWANVARWKGETHPKHFDTMEKRVERALKIKQCPSSCIHNGCFLLAKKGQITGNQALLEGAKNRLKKLIDKKKRKPRKLDECCFV